MVNFDSNSVMKGHGGNDRRVLDVRDSTDGLGFSIPANLPIKNIPVYDICVDSPLVVPSTFFDVFAYM